MNSKLFSALSILAFLLPAGLLAQDKDKDPDKDKDKEAIYGTVDFGVRYSQGEVYGRPDLQTGQCLGCGSAFNPALSNSKFNEYQDMRNGFVITRMDFHYDNILGSSNYLTVKSQRTLYRDQSYLATFGQYSKFKIQFRYDEIPHIYSSTARTLFTQTAPGVWSFPAAIRAQLQASTAANLPSLIAGTGTNAGAGVVTDFNFITPSILRRAGTALFSYNATAKWNVNGSFMRESERGSRPIGLIMNSSPSASASSGFGVELPEPINYFNNLLRIGADYGTRAWAVQAAFIGSFFQNDTQQMTWDNPFRLTTETDHQSPDRAHGLVSGQPRVLCQLCRRDRCHQVPALYSQHHPRLAAAERGLPALYHQHGNQHLRERCTGLRFHQRSAGVEPVRKQTDAGHELQHGDDRLERHSV